MGKLYEIYFSPTGGTKKIAEILGRAWDCRQDQIDLLRPEKGLPGNFFEREDICIFAVPSFSGRVPVPVLTKIRKMKGRGARAVLAAVYGNRDFDDTLAELRDALEDVGFVCVAAVAAVAEHSIARKYGAGRPDKRDREELEIFAAQIKQKLDSGDGRTSVQVPGNRPYRAYVNTPMKPKAGRSCIGCGKCVSECPVKAIPGENPASVDKTRCISCMHCVAICPVKARKNSRVLLAVAQHKLKALCSGRKENKLWMESDHIIL